MPIIFHILTRIFKKNLFERLPQTPVVQNGTSYVEEENDWARKCAFSVTRRCLYCTT